MGKGTVLTPGVKRVLWLTAAVVALAVVIFVVAAVSSPKSADEPAQNTAQSAELQAQGLAADAQAAASREDTAAARQLAQQALKLDAANAAARTVLDRIDEAEKANADAGAKPPAKPSTQPSQDAYLKEIKLAALLPAAITGWSAGSVVVEGKDALVTFEPEARTAPSRQVVRVIVNAHDRGSAAAAKEFVTKVDGEAYAQDGAKVAVGVVPDAYFGTDGVRVAVVAFSRGRYAFEVIATAQPGVSAAELKQHALDVAATLPAAR